MSDKTEQLLLEVAGLLNVLVQGHNVPNWREQATDLLDKIGAALASPEDAPPSAEDALDVVEELTETIHALRGQLSEPVREGIPTITRMRVDLALAHAQKLERQ